MLMSMGLGLNKLPALMVGNGGSPEPTPVWGISVSGGVVMIVSAPAAPRKPVVVVSGETVTVMGS